MKPRSQFAPPQPESALEHATRISGEGGRYRVDLDPNWMGFHTLYGGYLAAVALRAASAASGFQRAASLAVHFLQGGQPGPAELRVESMRRNKRSESLRVSLVQEQTRILEALVWIGIEGDGFSVSHDPIPEPRPASAFRDRREQVITRGKPVSPVWDRIETRFCNREIYESARPDEPDVDGWCRLRESRPMEGSLEDALRITALADGTFHDAIYRLVGGDPEDYAYAMPTVELSVHFHRAAPSSDWLFCRARCDQAAAGLVTGSARFWSGESGLLVASARSNLACRPIAKPRPGSRVDPQRWGTPPVS